MDENTALDKKGVFALAGNPNSGKTTIFNELTGSRQYVGNWTGVTVEKKQAFIKKSPTLLVDLPGIYSLSSTSMDEIIARDYLIMDKPDILLNVVDASNIERNLQLTLQLLELNVPLIIILNMMDEVERAETEINTKKLEELLGVECISTSIKNRSSLQGLSDIDIGSIKQKDYFHYLPRDILNAINYLSHYVHIKLDQEMKSSGKWLTLKLLEGDNNIIDTYFQEEHSLLEKATQLRTDIELNHNKLVSEIIILERYKYINSIVDKVVKRKKESKETISEKIDKVVTNRFLAIPIFLCIMLSIYYVTITGLGEKSIALMEWLIGDIIVSSVTGILGTLGVSGWVNSLVINGIIGGVGAVLVFVPQIMILFMFIAILEDSGYMTRVAFIMDQILKNFGLSGKSLIPLVIGSGCSVPGIMATRTIENSSERKLTVILTPFISCGAKLPIYIIFTAAFFPKGGHWLVLSLYIIGIVIAMISGIVLSGTRYRGTASTFIMELPPYRIPRVKSVFFRMWDRGKEFIVRAGTLIFLASVILWFLQSFNMEFQMTENPEESILAFIGRLIAPIFKPLGFGDWISAVAFLTGLAAKEVVIGTLGVLLGVGEDGLAAALGDIFTPLSAVSFMVFVLLSSPCVSAISAMKNEFKSWRETGFALIYQSIIAWIIAMIIYQLGLLII